MQGLAAGIGFLGAGAIIMGNQQGTTRGLATAANIWLTAAIGVSAGMGMQVLELISGALVKAWLI
jgi:putative Mg2+ transporter-C (MgtC) family protein